MQLLAVRWLGSLLLFLHEQRSAWSRPKLVVTELLQQTMEISFNSLLPVIVVVIPFGAVVAVEGYNFVEPFQAQPMLSGFLLMVTLREIAPVVTALMVAAQSGGATTGMIASMRLKHQFDAIELCAVPTSALIIIPRLLAFVVACPLINLIASASGIAGGSWIALVRKPLDPGIYFANLFVLLKPFDLWFGLVKTILFGFIIGSISIYEGTIATGGAKGVGVAANRAIVRSVIGCIILNYLFTAIVLNIWG